MLQQKLQKLLREKTLLTEGVWRCLKWCGFKIVKNSSTALNGFFLVLAYLLGLILLQQSQRETNEQGLPNNARENANIERNGLLSNSKLA